MAAALITSCTANAPAPTPTSYPRARVAGPAGGFEAYLWWKPEIATRDLGLVRDAGFGWVKQTLAWRDIELDKGKYDWSRADKVVELVNHFGLKMIARVDREPWWDMRQELKPGLAGGPPKNLDNFFDFCGKLAARYKGRIAAYQIWNEPNLAREWGGQPPDPKLYVEMLKGCYQAIKREDPEALVISAGLAPTQAGPPLAMADTDFLEAMYQAGAAPYFDLLGAHAAGYKAPPELSPDDAARNQDYGGQRSFTFRRVEDLRDIMVKHGDAAKQVAVLEFGWTSDPIHTDYAWFAIDEQTKADYMVRAFRFADANWKGWIGPMIALSIPQFDWAPDNEQYWWAVVDPVYPETKTRPAYEALKAMPKPR